MKFLEHFKKIFFVSIILFLIHFTLDYAIVKLDVLDLNITPKYSWFGEGDNYLKGMLLHFIFYYWVIFSLTAILYANLYTLFFRNKNLLKVIAIFSLTVIAFFIILNLNRFPYETTLKGDQLNVGLIGNVLSATFTGIVGILFFRKYYKLN